MGRVAACVGLARWGLLILSALMLTGHICVLPTHHHVETAPWHGDGHHPQDADEAMHAGSCEALPSAGITCQVGPIVSAFVVATPVEPLQGRVGRGDISPRPTLSPPLFLLHAALLI